MCQFLSPCFARKMSDRPRSAVTAANRRKELHQTFGNLALRMKRNYRIDAFRSEDGRRITRAVRNRENRTPRAETFIQFCRYLPVAVRALKNQQPVGIDHFNERLLMRHC